MIIKFLSSLWPYTHIPIAQMEFLSEKPKQSEAISIFLPQFIQCWEFVVVRSQGFPFNQRNKAHNLIAKLKKARETHKEKQAEKQAVKEILMTQPQQDVPMKEDILEKEAPIIEGDSVPVLIIKNDGSLSNGFAQSFTILLPQGYGLNIFRRLVYSGCKPLGHKGYLSLMLESGQPVFPEDYPHTKIGITLAKLRALDTMKLYAMKPPSKRVNYQSLNSLSPFMPSINNGKQYRTLNITAFQRGVPQANGYLCLPTEDDLKQLFSLTMNQLKQQAYIVEEPVVQGRVDNKQFNLEYSMITKGALNLSKKEQGVYEKVTKGEQVHEFKIIDSQNQCSLLPMSKQEQIRVQIGTVMRGCYSQIRGKGIGLSVVEKEALQAQVLVQMALANKEWTKRLQGKVILLMRNVNSRSYIPVIGSV